VAANAGIDDTQDLAGSWDGVSKPNLKTIEVDLLGPIYATFLAIQYFRSNSPNTGGKVVITSSTAGLYASSGQPQYGVAKYGCVALARCMGGKDVLKNENITINAVCPSFVPTGLAPAPLLKGMLTAIDTLTLVVQEQYPQHITPASTIVNAFNMFLEDGSLSGKVAECVIDKVYLRDPHPVRYLVLAPLTN
jgi:15-hydroxyprostaglandin dehydrogenase (NAD)